MDIYKKLTTEQEDENETDRVKRDINDNEIYLSPEDQYAIDESDIIMTFLNKSKCATCNFRIKNNLKSFSIIDHHAATEMRHTHGRRLWFDTSEIGGEVSLMMAELRLYQNSVFSKYDEEKQVNVRVYKADLKNE